MLVTSAMVKNMRAGSVIVDLAAERGGNCESTVPGETVVADGVTILGPTNLPAEVPFHTSQLYAKYLYIPSAPREARTAGGITG